MFVAVEQFVLGLVLGAEQFVVVVLIESELVFAVVEWFVLELVFAVVAVAVLHVHSHYSRPANLFVLGVGGFLM